VPTLNQRGDGAQGKDREGLTRREFTQDTLRYLLTFSLLDSLCHRDLFSAEVKPLTDAWLRQAHEIGKDLKSQKLQQLEWQKRTEALLAKVDLEDLLEFIDFDAMVKNAKAPKHGGEQSLDVRLPKTEGLPQKTSFGKQVFRLEEGSSVVPHGHNNMATAFLILKGKFRGRHFDRVEDHDEHLIIRPTIDKSFGPGDFSTVSDFKDNIHWFKAIDASAFIFNIHVLGVNPGSDKVTGRVYIDPQGEKLDDGLIRAPRIARSEARRLYG
jgi:hypothetical protein